MQVRLRSLLIRQINVNLTELLIPSLNGPFSFTSASDIGDITQPFERLGNESYGSFVLSPCYNSECGRINSSIITEPEVAINGNVADTVRYVINFVSRQLERN